MVHLELFGLEQCGALYNVWYCKMTLVVWVEKSGYSFGSFTEQVAVNERLPVTNDAGVVYSIISGELPPGLSIMDNYINGMPLLVLETTVFEFCIRASKNNEISDRTFTITITSNHVVTFVTPNGVLPIGIDGQTYAIDDTYVSFQLLVNDYNTAFGTSLNFTVISGNLPGGLTLSNSGLISGLANKLTNSEIDNGRVEYSFSILATDSFSSAIGAFSIVVVGPDYLTADNDTINDSTSIYTSDVSALRPIQWVTGSNLGTYRADNFITIVLEVVEPANIIYSIDNVGNLPPGMSFNTMTGVISGYTPVQVINSKRYSFKITATYTDITGEFISSECLFTMTLINNSIGDITWPDITNLGSIEVDFPSMFKIEAISYDKSADIVYAVIGGYLPPGLSMTQDGEILGKVNQTAEPLPPPIELTIFDIGLGTEFDDGTIFDAVDAPTQPNEILGLTVFDSGNTIFDSGITPFDREFNFTVMASDQYGSSSHDFYISVTTADSNKYSNIFVKPLLAKEQRNMWSDFINNANIFTYENLFRVNDPSFGVQTDLLMLICSGIETANIESYISAIGLNHTRKRFKFGSLNTAVATTQGTNDIIYEVVYITMIDPLEENGKHLPLEMNNLSKWKNTIQADLSNDTWSNSRGILGLNAPYNNRPCESITIDETGYRVSNPNPNTYYPSSILNWRSRLSETKDNSGNIVTINENYLPLWMSSIQPNKRQPIGFSLAVPLCYCKAGTAAGIMANINNYMTTTGFTFNELDYTIDRYIVDEISDEQGAKYLIFKNNRITI